MAHVPPAPEFSRPIRLDQIGPATQSLDLAADEAERLALARRFGLRAIDSLEAQYSLDADGDGWLAKGTLQAKVVQACVATGQDVPEAIDTPFAIRFLREAEPAAEEIELSEDECDVMTIEGDRIDMGEAVAQTLVLNLTPYPRAPDADEYLRKMGVKTEEEAGPLGALRALLDKSNKG
jgi:uncharacterized metal-binding protein YceD (DUF177 family)